MRALLKALNSIFEVPERCPWHRFTALTLLFTLGATVVLVCTMLLTLLLPHLLPVGETFLSPLRWPVIFGILAFGLATLYRIAPADGRRGWPFLTIGRTAAALLILLDSLMFSWFVGWFASLSATYGSLSTAVAFLLWLWSACLIVLLGAELDTAIGTETKLYGGVGQRAGGGKASQNSTRC